MAIFAVLLALATPSAALAQQGNGLYDPFPDPTTSRTAERYYAELGVAVTRAQLDDGRLLPGLPAARAADGPTARASSTAARNRSVWAVVAVIALVALILAVAAVLLRRADRRGRTNGTVALLLVLVAAGMALAPAHEARAVVPRDFFGLTSDDVFVGDARYQATEMARQRHAGVTVLRQSFNWKYLEPEPGLLRLDGTDRFVLSAARAGIRILPILFGEPAWASSRRVGDERSMTAPPRDPRVFAAYAAAIARRYGTHGTLWKAHPEVRAMPVRAYQVWNEPNLPVYWGGRPDARAYASMLKRTSGAVHRVQPGARIVSAGLPQSSTGVPLLTYLRQLYAAGAGPSIDTVGVNPYATSVAQISELLRAVRARLDASGARRTGLWVTEVGWATRGKSRFSVGPARQSQLIEGTLRALGASWRSLRLIGVVYYAWRDMPVWAGVQDFWGLHTGLHDIDGKPKPAVKALERAVKALR